MDRIIGLLEDKGMEFDTEGDDKFSACKYIKYNTSWNILKQSRNILYLNNNFDRKYEGISFFDIRIAGLVHYHFNNAIEVIVKAFEHYLKVYMSDKYENALLEEQQQITKKISYFKFNYNNNDIKLNSSNIFEFYSFATLRELLSVYKVMRSKIKSCKMPQIDSGICNVRNTIYHHNNLLIENKKSKNPKISYKRCEEFKQLGASEEQISYMKLNFKYNTLRQILDLIEHVHYFLSLDSSTHKQKEHTFIAVNEHLSMSKYYYNMLQSKGWVNM